MTNQNPVARVCCFIGTAREVGIFGRPDTDGKFSCTHSADWCIEYEDVQIPDNTTDACHDHLSRLLYETAGQRVTAIGDEP